MYRDIEEIFSEIYVECINSNNTDKKKETKIRKGKPRASKK